MSDARGTISGAIGQIEVKIDARDDGLPVDMVICHPHPLHGGTMDNKVVHTLARAGRDAGLRAIRFNFRGVGLSQGAHDGGRGEQDDLMAVLKTIAAITPGRGLLLAGFSFGAWVTAASLARLATTDTPPTAALLVAPPVHYAGFVELPLFPVPVTVFQGDGDEVVAAAAVAQWCAGRRPPLVPQIFATGHFFHGLLPELKAATDTWITTSLVHGGLPRSPAFPADGMPGTLPPP